MRIGRGGVGWTPEVVVTTTVLGSLVEDLVGDDADVRVLMPNGVDPHDFQPSARDAATLGEADLVVRNGLDLEVGLDGAVASARDAGVPVFTATDHVDEAAGGGARVAGDPHIWMDPLAIRDVVDALAPEIRRALGVDVSPRAAALAGRLADLDAEIRADLADIPAERRRLVTGHESMAWFADRYRFELVGALIPSLSPQAQVSASDLSALRAQIEREGVPAIFAELGTPDGVAEAIGEQTGARVVPIGTHRLPADGSYLTFMRDVAAAVHDGLAIGG